MGNEHDEGVAAAGKAIAVGRLTYFTGAPSRARWGVDLADTLRTRFNIEAEFVSDMTTERQNAFRAAFNAKIEEYIDGIHGKGSFAAAIAEVQERRLASYQAYFARKPSEEKR